MSKEIHFYENLPTHINIPLVYGWKDTEILINQGNENIHTIQMGLLSTHLFELGYKIFIHEEDKIYLGVYPSYEIKLGTNNERTNREIKMSSNLFNLWKAHEFTKWSWIVNEGKE